LFVYAICIHVKLGGKVKGLGGCHVQVAGNNQVAVVGHKKVFVSLELLNDAVVLRARLSINTNNSNRLVRFHGGYGFYGKEV